MGKVTTVLLLWPLLAEAAVPSELGFSGILADAVDVAIPDDTYNLTVSLYDASDDGNLLWTEPQPVETEDGRFSVLLGQTEPLSTELFGDAAGLWLEIAVDGETLTPRLAVTSVPYAIEAAMAQEAGDVVCDGCVGAAEADDTLQRRVVGVCEATEAMVGVNEDGTVECVVAAAATNYMAGEGLVLEEDTFMLAPGGVTFAHWAQNSCIAGEVPMWNGSSWACAADNDTTYSAGSGLELSSAGAFSIPTSGVTSAMVVDESIGSTDIQDGTITSSDILDSTILFADWGSNGCSSTQVPKWNGSSWACAADNDTTYSPTQNTLTTVDSTGSVGRDSSITIGTDGFPVVSYHYVSFGDLKVTKCGDPACSSGNTVTTVDDGADTAAVGQYTSITIGTDGFPVISYYDYSNDNLKIAKCGNAACSSGNTLTTVDSTGNVGQYTSITIGTDGFPVISYIDYTNHHLKIAKCGNAACSSGNTLTTVDSTGTVEQFTSIAIGMDGFPVISYMEYPSVWYLKVAKCGNAACSSGNTLTRVDSAQYTGEYNSITIGTDSFPVVSYYDGGNGYLKVAKCGNAACSSGNTLTTIDNTSIIVGYDTSITIGMDGFPIISYLAQTSDALKVAKCGNAACTSGNTIVTIDTGAYRLYQTSITIGTDGFPVVSYTNYASFDLKVAKCTNVICRSYWRRR